MFAELVKPERKKLTKTADLSEVTENANPFTMHLRIWYKVTEGSEYYNVTGGETYALSET